MANVIEVILRAKNELSAQLNTAGTDIQKFANKSLGSFSSLSAKSILAMGGITLAGAGVVKIVDGIASAAGEAELAQAMLADAMKRAGIYTQAAFKANLDFASSLSMSVLATDEEIAAIETQLTNFGVYGERLRALTAATLDFATAKRMDAVSAGDLMAKTVGSESNALARYGIEVRGAAGSLERMDAVLKGVQEHFGGAARAQTDSYTGSVVQLSKAWSELAESVGLGATPAVAVFNKEQARVVYWGRDVVETLKTILDTGKGFYWLASQIGLVPKETAAWYETNIGVRLYADALKGLAPPAEDAATATKTLNALLRQQLDAIVPGLLSAASKVRTVADAVKDFWTQVHDAQVNATAEIQTGVAALKNAADLARKSITPFQAPLDLTRDPYKRMPKGMPEFGPGKKTMPQGLFETRATAQMAEQGEKLKTIYEAIGLTARGVAADIGAVFAGAFDQMLGAGRNFTSALGSLFKSMISQMISKLAGLLVQWAFLNIITGGGVSFGSLLNIVPKHAGGPVPGYQFGGVVPGFGSGDRVPILAESGERVFTKQGNRDLEALIRQLTRQVGRGGNTYYFNTLDNGTLRHALRTGGFGRELARMGAA